MVVVHKLRRHLLILGFAYMNLSNAGDFQAGFSLGFGGLGISKEVSVDLGTGEDSTTQVNRANRPVTFGLFGEFKIDPFWMFNIEHLRGVTLGPFSSNTHFSGLNGRYYFMGEPPSRISGSSRGETVLRIKNLSFFGGLGAGLAGGKLVREGDLVEEVSSSALFFSGRIGSDYPLADTIGVRAEIVYGRSFFKSVTFPATLAMFSTQLSTYWMFP